jgi:four helix bundle protein
MDFRGKTGNPVSDKSFTFAQHVVPASSKLMETSTGKILGRQLLRSGTSIGANVEEALGGHSRADFYAKLGIAYKEARETAYWIRLSLATNQLPASIGENLLLEVQELLRIIGSIRHTLRVSSLKARSKTL